MYTTNACYLRFPDHASMIKAGFLLPHEAEHMASIDESTLHETTWTPILWAVNLIHTANELRKPLTGDCPACQTRPTNLNFARFYNLLCF